MVDKNEFLEDEKDCALMLGLSLDDYRNDLKNTKCPTKEQEMNHFSYDNSILSYLGLSEGDLKKRNHEV